jgi:hypothetical protein
MNEELLLRITKLEAKIAQLEANINERLDRLTNYSIENMASIIRYGNENELYQHLAMRAFFDERPEGYKNMSGEEVLAWSHAQGEAIDARRYAQFLAEKQREQQQK